MNVIQFESKTCEKIRSYLDSYLSNELLIETNHEVFKHLEACRECSAELENRTRVKSLLHQAARKHQAPPGLELRIRNDIRARPSGAGFRSLYVHWGLAAAAALLLGVGGWGVFRLFKEQTSTLGGRAAAVLGIGVSDHVECAVNHQMSSRRFTFEDMSASMGPEYIGLVPVVKERVPTGYQIVVAHKCHVNGREFVHLILKNQEKILSLAVTRKGADSFAGKNLVAALKASGIPLYNGRVDRYQVAGFESRDHFAFLVSDLGEGENLQLASSLAAPVREFLARIEI
jgi:anti-sigma factor (TIGR02949 family)